MPGEIKMEKFTGMIRKMDEVGRVVLPSEIRKMFDIKYKDHVEILLDKDNGRIILQKSSNRCLRCRSIQNFKKIRPGYHICDQCLKALM